MKKNSLIGILILLVAFAMTYAKIKANEAEKASTDVQLLIQESERLSEEAVQLKEKTLDAAAEAAMQKNRAEKALVELEKCLSK
jgi:hypothetical protein